MYCYYACSAIGRKSRRKASLDDVGVLFPRRLLMHGSLLLEVFHPVFKSISLCTESHVASKTTHILLLHTFGTWPVADWLDQTWKVCFHLGNPVEPLMCCSAAYRHQTTVSSRSRAFSTTSWQHTGMDGLQSISTRALTSRSHSLLPTPSWYFSTDNPARSHPSSLPRP